MNNSGKPTRIVAKPIKTQLFNKRGEKREIWATLCYYYPQYTLESASKLPVRDIKLLLKIAEEKEAEKMFNLTQISAAPHTKKGKGVKTLTEHFKKIMGK